MKRSGMSVVEGLSFGMRAVSWAGDLPLPMSKTRVERDKIGHHKGGSRDSNFFF